MTYLKYLSPLVACILLAFFATPVMAEHSAEFEAEGEAHVNLPPPPQKPLDMIKARALQIKQGAPGMKAEVELHGDARVGMPGPGERKGMEKERMGSSTPSGRGLKALVMMHGGVIKNRFHLAIEHMNNLLMRMDTRLGKMADEGIDTTSTAKLKVEAELAIDKAETDAKAVADLVAGVDESSDRAAVRTELQTKMKTAQESLKAAHAAVMKAVRALVQLAKTNKPKAGADASVETSVETDVQ